MALTPSLTDARVCPACENEQPASEFGDAGTLRCLTCFMTGVPMPEHMRPVDPPRSRVRRARPAACSCGVPLASENPGRWCPDCRTLGPRVERYGLTVPQFLALHDTQGRACGSCKTPEPDPAALHIDHDHDTDEVRGLLCPGCNHGIGMLGDTLAGVEKAAAYLRRALQRSTGGSCDTSDSSFYQTHNPVVSSDSACFAS